MALPVLLLVSLALGILALLGFAAVKAGNAAEYGARLVRDCKAEGLGGVATDLEGLIFEDGAPRDLVEITPSEPLWIERW